MNRKASVQMLWIVAGAIIAIMVLILVFGVIKKINLFGGMAVNAVS